MDKIRIIIADDHRLFREGLSSLLDENNEIDVVADVKDGNELLEAVSAKQPDIVLSDISMPGKTGIEVCALVNEKFPDVKFIMLSMYDYETFFVNSIRAGAKGFISKEISRDELILAIRTVYEGGDYYDKKLSNGLLKELIGRRSDTKKKQGVDSLLSQREKEIIRLVAESYSNAEIADRLVISIRTVNAHKNNIMRKLKLKSSVDIVKYAIANKIISI